MTRGDVTVTKENPRGRATANIPRGRASADLSRGRAKQTRGDGVGGSCAAPHTPR